MEKGILMIISFLLLCGAAFCSKPVILLPGDGGSRILAKLHKTYRSHFWCEKSTDDFFTLWLNVEDLLPYSIDCLIDNMKLHYNNKTRRTSNTPGVDIKVPGFGLTKDIEYLDSDHFITPGHYYSKAVAHFVSRGFTRGRNIRGAPYDFRKAPNEHEMFFAKLKVLVQQTYLENGNTSVVLIGHSMGCPMLLYFLNRMSQPWKDTYVKRLITLSGPFAGSVRSVQAFVSGYNLNTRFLRPLTVRPLQRTFPSQAFFLPSSNRWNDSEVLVKTPKRTYTVKDYKELFHDMDTDTIYEMWKDTKDLIYNLTPPGVEVHCLHGLGVRTASSLAYDDDFPNSSPDITYGDGDGTVNKRSLEACTTWIGKQKQPVFHKVYENVDHMGILTHLKTLVDLIKLSK